jgi:hypothetical protein
MRGEHMAVLPVKEITCGLGSDRRATLTLRQLSVFNTNVNRILEQLKAVERGGKSRLPEKVGVEAGGQLRLEVVEI